MEKIMMKMATQETINGLTISAVVDGYRTSRTYQGYSLEEAQELFLNEMKGKNDNDNQDI